MPDAHDTLPPTPPPPTDLAPPPISTGHEYFDSVLSMLTETRDALLAPDGRIGRLERDVAELLRAGRARDVTEATNWRNIKHELARLGKLEEHIVALEQRVEALEVHASGAAS